MTYIEIDSGIYVDKHREYYVEVRNGDETENFTGFVIRRKNQYVIFQSRKVTQHHVQRTGWDFDDLVEVCEEDFKERREVFADITTLFALD